MKEVTFITGKIFSIYSSSLLFQSSSTNSSAGASMMASANNPWPIDPHQWASATTSTTTNGSKSSTAPS
jgi:hypothetical protein